MKLRLTLVTLIIVPLLINAQAPGFDPKSGVVFYSKGDMYVAPKTTGQNGFVTTDLTTSLYIDGSAMFATGSQVEQKGRTEITGDFVNAKDPAVSEAAPHLFVNNSSDPKEGVIAFIGKQINGVATRQWIYGVTTDAGATWTSDDQKKTKYIKFPSVSVEKGKPGKNDDWRKVGSLTIDKTAAIKMDNLRVKNSYVDRNRLAVLADYSGELNGLNVGHLEIGKLYTVTEDPLEGMSELDLATYSQVDFNLYKYNGSTDDDGAFTGVLPASGTKGGTLRDDAGWNYLVGFAPPFRELGADYMFYHVLTKPSETSITSWEGPIVDPFFRMKNGRGYFMSMEVSPVDHVGNIDARWAFRGTSGEGIHHTKRARGGYVFNRMIFHDFLSAPINTGGVGVEWSPEHFAVADVSVVAGYNQMNDFSRFAYDRSEFNVGNAYKGFSPTGNRTVAGFNPTVPNLMENGKNRSRYELMDQETFVLDDVQVDLVPGLNFLGNPFMAPISLNPLLGLKMDGNIEVVDTPSPGGGLLENGFSVPELGGVTVSTVKSDVDLRAKYWVINKALIKYDEPKNIFEYKVTYDYVSRMGATPLESKTVEAGVDHTVIGAGIATPGSYLISPMQMFCLQAGRHCTVTLKKELRQMGGARIPKSASDNSELMRDWFVVEASDSERSFSDRTSIAFTDRLNNLLNNPYETAKGITKELGVTNPTITDQKGVKTTTEQGLAHNVLYTKSKNGTPLLGNAVVTKTKEMALYFNTPDVTQDVTLRFYGIENLEAVPGVWLVDRLLNTTTKVDADTEYTFVSNPSETKSLRGEDNRFILRFYPSEIITDGNNTEISCFYTSSTLRILGLNEGDMNSDIMIYDMQGRLMGKTKVTNYPTMDYVKPLGIGTYIVKVAGKRNFTTKFVNLNNN